MIINGKDAILGRIGTYAAKKALLGEKIDIINCEDIIITGNKTNVFAKYKRLRDIGGPFNGPFVPRSPDRFVRRTLRGMLPYKQQKGKDAFKRIMCYVGIPDKMKDQKTEELKEADASKLPNRKYTSVGAICKYLGGKL